MNLVKQGELPFHAVTSDRLGRQKPAILIHHASGADALLTPSSAPPDGSKGASFVRCPGPAPQMGSRDNTVHESLLQISIPVVAIFFCFLRYIFCAMTSKVLDKKRVGRRAHRPAVCLRSVGKRSRLANLSIQIPGAGISPIFIVAGCPRERSQFISCARSAQLFPHVHRF